MRRTLAIILVAITLAVVSLVLMVVSLVGWVHNSNRINDFVHSNCIAIEELKAGQREEAQATIDGDRAFLKAHPGGTDQFPESVVQADIDAKQKTVDRYPPKRCP